jgi:hypothetical protein
MSGTGLRKFKVERQVGRMAVNPLMMALERAGLRTAECELETIGRRSGLPRRVPLAGSADQGASGLIC